MVDAVNRSDDEHVRALGDHVFDLGQLVLDVIVGKLQVGLVTEASKALTMLSPSEIQRVEVLVGIEMPTMRPVRFATGARVRHPDLRP